MNNRSLKPKWCGNLVDAHRHGLYDISCEWSLAGVAVEDWSANSKFLAHERRTKSLFGTDLHDALHPWIEYSRNEGVGTVLDFSGKHASSDVQCVYGLYGVRLKPTVFWSTWREDVMPSSEVMILPDEREIGPDVAEVARSFLTANPEGIITLHAGESEARTKIGKARLGLSIVEWLAMESLLDSRTLLVHANTMASKDFGLIEDSGAGVVMCPLTRLALINPVPKVPQRVRVFFGTDAPLVSGSRSLIAQALAEAELWVLFGYTKIAAAERAAIALMRPLTGEQREDTAMTTDLAGFLFSCLIKERYHDCN